MSKYQHERQDPLKPSVTRGTRGCWWAKYYDAAGKFICDLSYTQPEALAKAYEFAALREASK